MAESLGAAAAEIVDAGAAGEVVAVFARSVYLRFPVGLVCIGDAAIGPGPLNIHCRDHAGFQWQNAAAPGMGASVDWAALTVGPLRVDLGGTAIWSPPPLPGWSGATAQAGIASLRAELPPEIPEGGLATVLASPEVAHRSVEPVLRAALPAIDSLLHWVVNCAATDPPEASLCRLLGLGPGLTPSGDDFLGGVLVALRLSGRADAADRLACAIDRLGPDRTNEISLAHLRAVSRFGLAEKLRRVVTEIFRGEAGQQRATLVSLSDAAHHSPWDTLAGLAAAFEAICGQPG